MEGNTYSEGDAIKIFGSKLYPNKYQSLSLADVDSSLIEQHGAVSEPVAEAMARGALHRFGADTAVAITGIAGPGGGTTAKPVGTVCFAVAVAQGSSHLQMVTRTATLPGNRTDVRERSTTVAMHLLRRSLMGDRAGSALV